jgi:hypothetical protein
MALPHKVKLEGLTQAVALIRANPNMTRTQFYATITQAANPLGLTQEQIEAAIQRVTLTIVALEYVDENEFDVIAPWIRALPEVQVPFMIESIYKKYLAAYEAEVAVESVATLEAALTESERLYLKFATLEGLDADETAAFRLAHRFHSGQAAGIKRKLIELGALPEESDLVEE